MSKAKKADADQWQFWKMVLETFTSSGLSVRQFCQQEGLSEASFYSWRKRLSTHQKPDTNQTPLQPEPFIQVSMPPAKPMGLELVLSSGHTLRIPVGVDRQTLTAVMSALGEAGLC